MSGSGSRVSGGGNGARKEAGAAIDWNALIPREQQEIYAQVIRAARERGIPFAVGGAVARTIYTGQWRNTKDLDIYVMPEDRDQMKLILSENGLQDFFDEMPYDRKWIYRGTRDGVLVDVIWAMANQRCRVDEKWIAGGPTVDLLGEPVEVVPVEELIWAKLYVMQRDRCDWPDILNILNAQAERLDWKHLLQRVGPDAPLLGAVLVIYAWLRPEAAAAVPEFVRNHLLPANAFTPDDRALVEERIRLLDGRPWFGAEISIDTSR